MALEFLANDPLTNQLWARRVSYQAMTGTYIDKFSGKSENNIFQIKTETKKNAGDRVTCGLVLNLVEDGVLEGTPLETNEEDIRFVDDSFIIAQHRHGTTVKGQATVSQQRVPNDLRDIALQRMGQWWAERHDIWAANQLSGNTSFVGPAVAPDIRRTGLQPPIAPTATHHIRAGNAPTDEAIAATDTFKLKHLDIAVERAQTLEPLIRPIMVKGQPFYIVFLHTHQVVDLKTAAFGAGTWDQIQANAMQGGEIGGNPIFTGALGVYNQCILHQWQRLPQGVDSGTSAPVPNTRRAVLCGAQAAWCGYGQKYGMNKMYWAEETFDYGETLGVGVGCVGGLKKSVYSGSDYATITITTAAAPHDDS